MNQPLVLMPGVSSSQLSSMVEAAVEGSRPRIIRKRAEIPALKNRHLRFYRKTIFAVVVSGSSGGDSVAKQLLGALNVNKSFRLPPRFALMEVAHQPGEIATVSGIESRGRDFARHLQAEIKA